MFVQHGENTVFLTILCCCVYSFGSWNP